MTERILAFQPLTSDQAQELTTLGAEVIPADDWETATGITVIFGWHREHGPKVLQNPANTIHWIQTASAGVDYLPLDWIKAHQIRVTNASGAYSGAIAESTIGYLLYFLRGFNESVKNQAGHFWQRPARSDLGLLSNQKIVIYGTGSIGQAIANLLNGFGNYPFGVNRTGHGVTGFQGAVALADDTGLVKDADVVINAMPATSATDHYFGRDYFKHLDGLRVFVNVGRGKSVDEAALMDALLYQNVLHAALDVFETEPLPKTSRLWDYPNVIITPHQTGFAAENTLPIFGYLKDNLTSWTTDHELTVNLVDVSRGY
ncbi:NAD(P)-dependent oxidoreductase [Levilactobacillus senmaizukei]|nr:NAD(P)-dependent oxidoreductase [Levilactobacillus senmaizukei]